jgi:hypothetical protein
VMLTRVCKLCYGASWLVETVKAEKHHAVATPPSMIMAAANKRPKPAPIMTVTVTAGLSRAP